MRAHVIDRKSGAAVGEIEADTTYNLWLALLDWGEQQGLPRFQVPAHYRTQRAAGADDRAAPLPPARPSPGQKRATRQPEGPEPAAGVVAGDQATPDPRPESPAAPPAAPALERPARPAAQPDSRPGAPMLPLFEADETAYPVSPPKPRRAVAEKRATPRQPRRQRQADDELATGPRHEQARLF